MTQHTKKAQPNKTTAPSNNNHDTSTTCGTSSTSPPPSTTIHRESTAPFSSHHCTMASNQQSHNDTTGSSSSFSNNTGTTATIVKSDSVNGSAVSSPFVHVLPPSISFSCANASLKNVSVMASIGAVAATCNVSNMDPSSVFVMPPTASSLDEHHLRLLPDLKVSGTITPTPPPSTARTAAIPTTFQDVITTVVSPLQGTPHQDRHPTKPLPNKGPYICLNMIVKNESHIIKRCIDNVASLIDFYAIVDTGSTDNTIEIMSQELTQTHGINGVITVVPWVNFGYNRTAALRFAEQSIQRHYPDRPLDQWYLLFMDADNLALAPDADFSKLQTEYLRPFRLDRNQLHADIVHATMVCTGIRYDYAWLCSLRRKWRWCGVLHEYLDLEPEDRAKNGIPTLQSLSSNDGLLHGGHEGARSKDPEKYRKDALMLEEEMRRDPGNSRNWFYAGNSWRNCSEFLKAEQCYIQRTKMGGWKQEVYMSFVDAARCRLRRGAVDGESHVYIAQAMEICPERLEAPYTLMRLCEVQKWFNLGFSIGIYYVNGDFSAKNTWYRFHEEVVEKQSNYLFLDTHLYAWQFLDVLSLCAHYSGHTSVFKQIMQYLLKHIDVIPVESERERIKKNATFIQ